jgi:3-methylcrotonyl-CoA carboxylase alpha subunit
MTAPSPRLPRRLLIANRGEIACRITRTARRLGIETVAVHSDADAGARHGRLADRAERIGPAAAAQSYLDIDALLAAARRSGADAVHPGYGFLSENARFAEACADAGLVFVGPPPAAIRAMGSKSEAKRLLEEAGVPLAPGYHGERQEPSHLAAEAARIGWPLLIKASAGGGGKGIRRVDRAEDFAAALAACQREAQSSFGDARVLLEKFIERPRHIEIQVFADRHGGCIHLGERDCSIQRRHQKVLEEAPAPGMTAERRAAMGRAAVAAAQRVGYVGAGTVEFIAAPDGTFFFMEMNTRLQVEHPVTEKITGLDLVEWQLRIAGGEPLPLAQEQIRLEGHAIEVRLYAEDPSRGFLPSPGRLLAWQAPEQLPGVRIDAGIETGDEITPYYDAMIAKIIAHGSHRTEALDRLQAALRDTVVAGPRTNLGFLRRLLATRSVRECDLDTALIERERAALQEATDPVPDPLWSGALAAWLLTERDHASRDRDGARSPWDATDGFRLVGNPRRRLTVEAGDERRGASLTPQADGWQLRWDDGPACALHAAPEGSGRLRVSIDGSRRTISVVVLQGPGHGGTVHASAEGRDAILRILDPRDPVGTAETVDHGLRAPMPGRIVAVLVRAGDRVRRGTPLLALEAMKMEHVLTAPADGIVSQIRASEGAQVAEGVTLVEFEPD